MIELVIYMSLFSILIGSSMVVVFDLIEHNRNMNYGDHSTDEIIFIIQKIDLLWGKIDTNYNPIISGDNCQENLKFMTGTGTALIRLKPVDHKILEIKKPNEEYTPLSSENLNISCINFEYFDNTPQHLEIKLTINTGRQEKEFTIEKYIP